MQAIEQLEQRRLMSSVIFVASSGKLFVSGTAGPDAIGMDIQNTGVTVTDSGQEIYSSLTSGDDVQSVIVHGGASKDHLTGSIDESEITMVITGDDGNDFIAASAFRSDGASVYGGSGSDIIRVGTSLSATFDGSYVKAGDGDDFVTATNSVGAKGSTLLGGEGNDSIKLVSQTPQSPQHGHVAYGQGGDDTIVGGLQDDYIVGGDGNDSLTGGGDADILRGGDGTDSILANDGVRDVIDGGPGTDTIDSDNLDDVTS